MEVRGRARPCRRPHVSHFSCCHSSAGGSCPFKGPQLLYVVLYESLPVRLLAKTRQKELKFQALHRGPSRSRASAGVCLNRPWMAWVLAATQSKQTRRLSHRTIRREGDSGRRSQAVLCADFTWIEQLTHHTERPAFLDAPLPRSTPHTLYTGGKAKPSATQGRRPGASGCSSDGPFTCLALRAVGNSGHFPEYHATAPIQKDHTNKMHCRLKDPSLPWVGSPSPHWGLPV